MEELKAKFPNNAQMKAKYELYGRKCLAMVNMIKNSLQEEDLMVELVSSAQPFEFTQNKRKSLILQQNAGYRSYLSPKVKDNEPSSD